MILAQGAGAGAPVKVAAACLPAETLLVETVCPTGAHHNLRAPPDNSSLTFKQATTWLLAM